MMTAGLQVSTPTDTTIVMTRVFHAPRRLVWEAMTDPARIPQWLFAPPTWTMTACEGRPRVGGSYRWEWANERGERMMTIHGVFKEVVPPERVSHTEIMDMGEGSGCAAGPLGELLATIELREKDGVTHMLMTLQFGSKEERDGALQSGMEHGMEAGYKQLDALLADEG